MQACVCDVRARTNTQSLLSKAGLCLPEMKSKGQRHCSKGVKRSVRRCDNSEHSSERSDDQGRRHLGGEANARRHCDPGRALHSTGVEGHPVVPPALARADPQRRGSNQLLHTLANLACTSAFVELRVASHLFLRLFRVWLSACNTHMVHVTNPRH